MGGSADANSRQPRWFVAAATGKCHELFARGHDCDSDGRLAARPGTGLLRLRSQGEAVDRAVAAAAADGVFAGLGGAFSADVAVDGAVSEVLWTVPLAHACA